VGIADERRVVASDDRSVECGPNTFVGLRPGDDQAPYRPLGKHGARSVFSKASGYLRLGTLAAAVERGDDFAVLARSTPWPAWQGPHDQGVAMQIILSDFISLDGVVQAPGGREEDTDGGFAHGGWSNPYFDPETMGAVIGEVMDTTQALLFGRRTWQTMAAAWPERAGDPFADRMNEIPKYVASRTLTQEDLTWSGSTLLPAEDAIGAVRELRARDGKALQVWGSSSLAAQLIENDLVDEYRLMVEPILLGGGKRLFPDDGQVRPLELVGTTTAKTGVLVCTYRPPAR
jgi:dihydrofolate reductase